MSGSKNDGKPIIYVIDLETSPATALFYGSIWEPVIVQVKDTMQILSCSIRKFGEKKNYYYAQNLLPDYVPGKLNDRELVQQIVEHIKDGDFICGHNIDQFDIPVIKERIMFHRLPPFPYIPTLDTKKLIKTTSRLPSNKLQHVTEFLGNGGKIQHSGSELFIACMEGDEKAWKINRKYNKHDVDITYKDLEDMFPYVRLNNKQKAFGDGVRCKNPACLSLKLQRRGFGKVVGGHVARYQCTECGAWFQGTKQEAKVIMNNDHVSK